MQYQKGVFGVLNLDGLAEEPLILMDGGIEGRYREKYDYRNEDRAECRGYLFQYTLSGSGSFVRNGEQYDVTEGKGFLVCFPERSRYFLPENAEKPWEFLYLHFDGAAAEVFIKEIERQTSGLLILDRESPPIRMALQLQRRMAVEKEHLEKYEGGEFLYRFLCALLRETERGGAVRKNSLVENAEEYMRKRYPSIQGIEEVAGRLSVSPAHLSRTFRKERGISPVEFLTRQKLQAAVNDLLGTDKRVETIARENGFSNGNYFGKVFRRYMGISPGAYRERNRG